MWPEPIDARPNRINALIHSPQDSPPNYRTDHDTICEEMERLQPVCDETQSTVISVYLTKKQIVQDAERQAEALRIDRLIAEEKARGTAELLEDVTRGAKAARKENHVLKTQIAKLQSGIETFTNEQAKQEMCLLYNDLKQWSFSHFRIASALGERDDTVEPKERYEALSQDVLQSEIAGLIYRSFWTTFSVNYGAYRDEHFRKLDGEVTTSCPIHGGHHWRCALSKAASSLESLPLHDKCNEVVDETERLFEEYSATDKTKRSDQLYDIVWRCLQFKHLLECQKDSYIFWCSQPKMPFRDERMCGLTEETNPNAWVEFSLWSCLNKINPSGEWSVVEREIVKTSSFLVFTVEPRNELNFQQCEEEF